MNNQLFPRQPKRMKQPHKKVLREQLRIAADKIIEQGAEIQRLRRPWWKRINLSVFPISFRS